MSDESASGEQAVAAWTSTQSPSSPTTATGCTVPVAPSAPGPGHATAVPPPVSGYASWTHRMVAGLLDRLPALLAAALLAAGYVQSLLAAGRAKSLNPEWSAGADLLTAGLVALLVAVLWTVGNRWWLQGRTGRSLGKRALGLTLLGDWTGAPVGIRHVALRDLVHALDALTVVGYLEPLWDPRRQTLADKLTRTVVTCGSRPA